MPLYSSHAEKLRVYRERDREAYRRKRAEWREANPEKTKESSREWYARNKEIVAARARQRYAEDSEYRAKQLAKQARRKGAIGTFSDADIGRIRTAQKSRCAVCRKRLIAHHIDHIVPLALGGVNFPRNLQLLCPGCNTDKGARIPEEFMRSRGYLL